MQDFVHKTGESCSISILTGTDIIYVARVSTKRIMSINLDVGSELPAYATSMGHVLLANLSTDELEKYLNNLKIEKYTDKTILDKDQLRMTLEDVRANNWGGVDQQFEEGASFYCNSNSRWKWQSNSSHQLLRPCRQNF